MDAGYVLSQRAKCSCNLSDSWVEVMLLKRFQVSEFLAEECEVVGEARPHAEWPELVVFTDATMGVFC
jgi:hypothetical protein